MIKVSLVIALAASAQAFHLRPSKVPLQRITHSRFKASTAVLEPDVRADEFASGSEVSHFETSSSIRPIDSLHLGAIRKALPKEVFEKSLSKSLYYMFKDYAIWGSAVLAFSTLVKSSLWARMPFLGKAAATFVYSQVCGLMMWCVFVVGHDCGHTTFSNNKLLNDILGHVTHGSLMVPFYPWQVTYNACILSTTLN
ncbi:hypothetical protein B484DRAFT_404088 [Ochromonadaceae sp. CCMP2298]|nr:hypothetical protein B484DRAFT_404088 [Ochromonadaceae sp. CCMP2298]